MEVDVYRNLHKNVWSVRNRATGRVRQYADKFVVRNAKFIVQPAGRAKVLREQRKNVHAFVRGTYGTPHFHGLNRDRYSIEVSYNPYKAGSFLDTDGNEVHSSDGLVLLDMNGKAYIQDSTYKGME